MGCSTWGFIISVGWTQIDPGEMRFDFHNFRNGFLSRYDQRVKLCFFFFNDLQSAAFEQFLNASRFGHVTASVEAARYLSMGSLEGVSQDMKRAVM